MSNRVIVEEAPDVLDPNALLAKLPTDTCGAIVSFIGIIVSFEESIKASRFTV